MDGDVFMRQSGFVDPRMFDDVLFHVVGVGGIGSITTLLLSKFGARHINVYDDDVTEAHNVANQFLIGLPKFYGEPKVEQVKKIVGLLGCPGVNLNTFQRRVTADTPFESMAKPMRHVFIVGPDSMAAREEIWGIVKDTPGLNLAGYIDARMASRFFAVYAGKTIEDLVENGYEDRLYSSETIEEQPCSDKAVIHTNAILGGVIVEMARRCVDSEAVEPAFETMFDLSLMMMTREEVVE